MTCLLIFLQESEDVVVSKTSAESDPVDASEKQFVNDTTVVADVPDSQAKITDEQWQCDDSGDVNNADSEPPVDDAEPEQPAVADLPSSEDPQQADDSTDNPPKDATETDASVAEPPREKTVDVERS